MGLKIIDSASTTGYGNTNCDSTQLVGQTFEVQNSAVLKKLTIDMKTNGSPSGTFTFSIYAISGALGSTAVPTGSALATSDSVSVSSLTASYAQYEVAFSGVNQIDMLDGEQYAIVCNYANTAYPNAIFFYNKTPSFHSGNQVYNGGSWAYLSAYDMAFKLEGEEIRANDIKNNTALTTGLISSWEMEEASGDREDSHGSITLEDNATVGSGVGKEGTGADFERSNSEFFSVANADKGDLNVGGDYSVSFWIKLEQLPSTANDDFDLIMNAFGTTYGGYRIFLFNTSNQMGAYFWNSGATQDTTDKTTNAMFTASDVGKWVHVAITVDVSSSTGTKIYKNGVSQTMTYDGTRSTTMGTNNGQFTMGINQNGTDNALDGMMDSVRIWDKILTDEELSDLDNDGFGLPYDSSPTGTFAATITIDKDKVDGDLDNYPLYVDLSDLGTLFWSTVKNGGGDIRIYRSDDMTQVARQVVFCDTSTDEGELHIGMRGTLESTVDTDLLVYVDGVSSEPNAHSAYGSQAVWPSEYKAVHHFQQDPSAGDYLDSTRYGNDGSPQGGMTSDDNVTGALSGYAADVDGGDTIEMAHDESLNFDYNDPHSIQSWVKVHVGSQFNGLYKGGTGQPYLMWYGSNRGGTADSLYAHYRNNKNNEDRSFPTSDSGLDDNNFHLSHGTYDGAASSPSSYKFYKDGAEITSITSQENSLTTQTVANTTTKIIPYQSGFLNIYDEWRMRSGVLSADWISTEYNNQSSPSTFYSVTDEEGGGSVAQNALATSNF